MRAYETKNLALLRRASTWSVGIGFASWAVSVACGFLQWHTPAEIAIVFFLVGGFCGALLWLIYSVLIAPRWCRHVWQRVRAFRSGT